MGLSENALFLSSFMFRRGDTAFCLLECRQIDVSVYSGCAVCLSWLVQFDGLFVGLACSATGVYLMAGLTACLFTLSVDCLS